MSIPLNFCKVGSLGKKLNIVLATANIKFDASNKVIPYLSLGIASLANNIDQRHNIKLLEPGILGLKTIKDIVDKISHNKPDIIGFSMMTQGAHTI